MGVFLSAIQRRIIGPRFAGFCGRKQREIQNWICNLGNLSQTRAICMTACQEMTCFLLFDKLWHYTVQNFFWIHLKERTLCKCFVEK